MNTPECCDKPRGFVGETCDYCGGTVQPEITTQEEVNRDCLYKSVSQFVSCETDLKK